MATTEIKNNAFVVRDKYKSGWEMWVLLMSDEHFDGINCDRALLKKHHEEAKERNALIFKFGDIFDCIKKDALKFYSHYKNNIVFISPGNHEQSILKNHEIDLTESLGEGLNCHVGKYAGFIKFFFINEAGGGKRSFTLYYTHGSGGGAPVTKGVIKNNRRQHTIDADFYVSGHIHTGTLQPRPKVYLNEQCIVKRKEPEHIILGAYKNEFLNGGWEDSKEFDPPVLGGMWLRFYFRNSKVLYDLIRAK